MITEKYDGLLLELAIKEFHKPQRDVGCSVEIAGRLAGSLAKLATILHDWDPNTFPDMRQCPESDIKTWFQKYAGL